MAKSNYRARRPKAYKYNTKVGGTDYNIPVFGYKSAFIILIATFIPLLVVPNVCSMLKIDYRILTILLTGLVSGFSVAYTQFFIERKLGATKYFWIVGSLVSLFAAVLVFILIYDGVLL